MNFPPKFANGIKPKNIVINLKNEVEVDLPVIIDTENNPVTVIQKLPSFIKFKNEIYYMSPTVPPHHLGFFVING